VAVYWERLTTKRFEAVLGSVATVLLPVGAVEAHGLHGPLGADNLTPVELCRRLEARYPDRLLVAPAIPYGHAWDLEDWPGTLNIPAAALEVYVAAVGGAMSRWGIRDLVLVNGHGGNVGALTHAAEQIADLGVRVTLSNWWVDYGEEIRRLVGGQGHAGEDETSVLMALAPETVDGEAARSNRLRPVARMKDHEVRQRVWRYATSGDPSRASAALGETILAAVVDRLDQLLQRLWADQVVEGSDPTTP
jgi:creatinine amidohydrolase